MIFPLSQVVIDQKMRGLCRRPYPLHPKGCPNFAHNEGCPPSRPLWNLQPPFYAVVNEFDLGAHVARMRELHPGWSQRQLECCLYWQGGARKILKDEIQRFRRDHGSLIVDTCPEAAGVNVTETLALAGIELEWPPVAIVRQVAIAGRPPHAGEE